MMDDGSNHTPPDSTLSRPRKMPLFVAVAGHCAQLVKSIRVSPACQHTQHHRIGSAEEPNGSVRGLIVTQTHLDRDLQMLIAPEREADHLAKVAALQYRRGGKAGCMCATRRRTLA